MPRKGENIYKRKDGRWEGRYKKGRSGTGKTSYGYVYARPIEKNEQDCVRHSLHGISASHSRQMRRSSFPISLKNGLPPSSNSSRYRPETSITTYSTIISSQLTVPFPWRRSQTPSWISTANSSYLPRGGTVAEDGFGHRFFDSYHLKICTSAGTAFTL